MQRSDGAIESIFSLANVCLSTGLTSGGFDQTKPGFPEIYPVTAGFRLTKEHDLGHTAVIANYDRGLEAIALAEMFDGRGSVLMTGFELAARVGKDPVADRVLRNLVAKVDPSLATAPSAAASAPAAEVK